MSLVFIHNHVFGVQGSGKGEKTIEGQRRHRVLANSFAAFQSLTENIDTTTPGGRLIFHLLGALAEFERDLIRERVQAGLKSARARGRKGGRPPVPEEIQSMAKALIADKSLSVKQICDRLGIAKSTFYKYARSNP